MPEKFLPNKFHELLINSSRKILIVEVRGFVKTPIYRCLVFGNKLSYFKMHLYYKQ